MKPTKIASYSSTCLYSNKIRELIVYDHIDLLKFILYIYNPWFIQC